MITHKNRKVGSRLCSSQSDDVFNPATLYNQNVISEVGVSDTLFASRDISNPTSIILTKIIGGYK
jgi:hypothetical protein